MINKKVPGLVVLIGSLLFLSIFPQDAFAGNFSGVEGVDVGETTPDGDCSKSKVLDYIGKPTPSELAKGDFHATLNFASKYENWYIKRKIKCEMQKTDYEDATLDRAGWWRPPPVEYILNDVVYGPRKCPEPKGLRPFGFGGGAYPTYMSPGFFSYTTTYHVIWDFDAYYWNCPKDYTPAKAATTPSVSYDLNGDGKDTDDYFTAWDPEIKIHSTNAGRKLNIAGTHNILYGISNGVIRNANFNERLTDDEDYKEYNSLYILESTPSAVISPAMSYYGLYLGAVFELHGKKYAVIGLEKDRIKVGPAVDKIIHKTAEPNQELAVNIGRDMKMQYVVSNDSKKLFIYEGMVLRGFIELSPSSTAVDLSDDISAFWSELTEPSIVLQLYLDSQMLHIAFVHREKVTEVVDGESALGYARVKVFDPTFASNSLGADSVNLVSFLGENLNLERGGSATLLGTHLPLGSSNVTYEETVIEYTDERQITIKRVQYAIFPFVEGWWDRISHHITSLLETAAVEDKTPAQSVEPPMKGIIFQQVDFKFSLYTIENSRWGRMTLTDGFARSGFLNVYTDAGWVVQNLLLARDYDLTTYFDIGSDRRMRFLDARVQVNEAPLETFDDGKRLRFPVSPVVWNAEGAGVGIGNATHPPPPNGTVIRENRTWSYILPNTTNVEAAKDQCVPMSVANSLSYLRAHSEINVPQEHKPGLRGDDSLVGKLGEAMGRSVTNRTHGYGVWFQPMLQGKFKYLKDNGLEGALIHKHQGRGWGNPAAGQALPEGDFTSSGITSKDNGRNITWGWICDEIKAGEDVELIFSYDNNGTPTGGHAVRVYGCGETLGVPWIRYLHDRNQANDSDGLEWSHETNIVDLDGDGILNFGAPGREIRFALAESPAPPEKSTWEKFVDWLKGFF